MLKKIMLIQLPQQVQMPQKHLTLITILDTGIAAAVCDDEYKDAETTDDGTEAPLAPSK